MSPAMAAHGIGNQSNYRTISDFRKIHHSQHSRAAIVFAVWIAAGRLY
jgi:hypothetical protein